MIWCGYTNHSTTNCFYQVRSQREQPFWGFNAPRFPMTKRPMIKNPTSNHATSLLRIEPLAPRTMLVKMAKIEGLEAKEDTPHDSRHFTDKSEDIECQLELEMSLKLAHQHFIMVDSTTLWKLLLLLDYQQRDDPFPERNMDRPNYHIVRMVDRNS